MICTIFGNLRKTSESVQNALEQILTDYRNFSGKNRNCSRESFDCDQNVQEYSSGLKIMFEKFTTLLEVFDNIYPTDFASRRAYGFDTKYTSRTVF